MSIRKCGQVWRRFLTATVVWGAGAVLFSFPISSQAAFYFAQNPGGTVFDGAIGEQQTLGSKFTVGSTAIQVTALGVYDYNSDGLKESHPVGLWNADGTVLLASATLSARPDYDTLVSGFRYKTLTSPVTLDPNVSYVIGAYYPAAQTYKYQTASSALAHIDSHLALDEKRSYIGSNLTYPNSVGTSGSAFLGASFAFTVVPEPAMWKPLWIVAVLASATAGLRLRRSRSQA